MTSMSSPRIKKPGLVSKSYRMSRPGLGCKMAGGFITTAWENKDIKTTHGKTVEIFLGMKPNKKQEDVEKIILFWPQCTLWIRRSQRWKTTDLPTSCPEPYQMCGWLTTCVRGSCS